VRPVEQTELVPGGNGNCVAACVASIFDVPLSDCYPDIPLGGDFNAVCRWTDARYPGLAACSVDFFDAEAWKPIRRPLEDVEWPTHRRSFWIAFVESPRAAAAGVLDSYGLPTQHAVVMHGSELAWDPHPRRDMGVGPCCGKLWWEVRNPAVL
jgi:hypothetical protein